MNTTLSSRSFNQNTSGAKQSALDGPVFITDRGQPSHVLLSIDDYRKLTESQPGITELLVSRAAGAIEFDPPRLRVPLRDVVDFD